MDGRGRIRGAIYARYSTERQNSKSIRDQIQICRDYADREGIEVVAVYTDEEKSGYSANREGLLKLLQDASKKKFDVLLVEHTSRLARDGLELRKLLNEFRFVYQIPIIFVSQNLRTDREQDLAIIKLFNIVDEQYVEAIRLATRRGLEGLFHQGKWAGGSAPFGYEAKDGRLVIKEDEAQIVRWIYEQYKNGMGLKNICKELNKRGIKTKKGNEWSPSTLSGLIKNPIYKGLYTWGRRRFILDPFTGKRKVVPGKPLQRYDESLKIVDEETWEFCNQKLKQVKAGKPKGKRINPLTGLLKCGVCGNYFIKERNKLYCAGYRNKKSCSNDIVLDYEFVFKWLVKNLQAYAEMHKEELLKKIQELKGQEARNGGQELLKKYRKKLENLLELYSENPSPVIKEKIKEIEKRIKEIERETEKIKPNLDVLLSKLERIFKLNPEEANRILKLFAQEIEIVPNNGIVQIRIKKGSALPKVLTKRLVAGAGFEPATSGL